MNVWTILDIPPTKDKKKIQAAYAALLKQYHPEEHPEAFAELQHAYREAIAQAKRAAHTPEFTAQDIFGQTDAPSQPERTPQGTPRAAGPADAGPNAKPEAGTQAEQGASRSASPFATPADDSSTIDFDRILQESLQEQPALVAQEVARLLAKLRACPKFADALEILHSVQTQEVWQSQSFLEGVRDILPQKKISKTGIDACKELLQQQSILSLLDTRSLVFSELFNALEKSRRAQKKRRWQQFAYTIIAVFFVGCVIKTTTYNGVIARRQAYLQTPECVVLQLSVLHGRNYSGDTAKLELSAEKTGVETLHFNGDDHTEATAFNVKVLSGAPIEEFRVWQYFSKKDPQGFYSKDDYLLRIFEYCLSGTGIEALPLSSVDSPLWDWPNVILRLDTTTPQEFMDSLTAFFAKTKGVPGTRSLHFGIEVERNDVYLGYTWAQSDGFGGFNSDEVLKELLDLEKSQKDKPMDPQEGMDLFEDLFEESYHTPDEATSGSLNAAHSGG